MSPEIICLLILMVLAIIDYRIKKIHNIIVLPAIVLGIYLTGNWHWALIMFCLLVYCHYDKDYNEKGFLKWGGGDVKLFTMIASFLGWIVIPIIIFTVMFIGWYRKTVHLYYISLPVAPFVLVSSTICISMMQLRATIGLS